MGFSCFIYFLPSDPDQIELKHSPVKEEATHLPLPRLIRGQIQSYFDGVQSLSYTHCHLPVLGSQQGSWRQLVTTQSGSSERQMLVSAHFLLNIQSGSPVHGMGLPTFKVGLPSSANPV